MSTKKISYERKTTTIVQERGFIEIDTSFTQIYHCMSEIAPYINSVSSYKLLFWLLANEVNKSNCLVGSKNVYMRFNDYLREKCGNCTISYRTFINCMAELKEAKAITQIGRGHYYFNPYIFWQDDKKERLNFIKAEAQDMGMVSFNPIQKKIEGNVAN